MQGFPLSQSFFRFSYLNQNLLLGNETESQLREFDFTTLVERRLALLCPLRKIQPRDQKTLWMVELIHEGTIALKGT